MTGNKVERLLRRTGRSLMRVGILRGAAVAIAMWIVCLLAVVIIDAALGLPPLGLMTLNLLLAATLVGGVVYICREAWRLRYRPRWIARQLEMAGGVHDSRLINAVDLAGASGGSVAASDALRMRAVAMGNELAGQLSPGIVVDRRRLWRSIGWLVVSLAVIAIAWLAAPRMFDAVAARLAAPWADHPPYTSLTFDVQINPDVVLYGKPATIQVDVRGPRLPDNAAIVFVDGDQRQRLPMLRPAGAVDGIRSFSLHIERAEQPRQFHVETPGGRSRRYDLSVKPVPLFESVHVAYTYPAYTGWEGSIEPLPARGIRTLAGTVIRFDIKSNVPLGEGRITRVAADGSLAQSLDDASAVLSPQTSDPTAAQGALIVTQGGRYAIELLGVDGTPGLQPLFVDVIAVADGAPHVDVAEPPQRLVAPPDRVVEVGIAARDDIGIGSIALHRGINGWGPARAELAPVRSAPNRATAAAVFDLPALGVQPGDVITYFAVATDNRPDTPNMAESRVHTIEVISVESWIDFIRTRRGAADVQEEIAAYNRRLIELAEQRQEIVEQLKDLRSTIDAGQPLTADQQRQMAELSEALQSHSQQIGQLADELARRAQDRPIYDFEQALHDQMEALARELSQQQRQASELGEQLGAARAGDAGDSAPLRPLVQPITRFIDQPGPLGEDQQHQREMTEQELAKLAAASELMGQAETLRQIILAQRELAKRMAPFKHVEQLDTNQQLRAAKLADEQAQLKADLERVRNRLAALSEQHRELLPKMTENGIMLVRKLDELNVNRDQDAAERLASAGRGRLAHASAESAAAKLETLLSDCQAQGDQMADDMDGCLTLPRESWANAANQLRSGLSLSVGIRGGSGSGFSGSMASMAIAGATQGDEGDSQSDAGQGRGDGDGPAGRADAIDLDTEAAEMLDPDSTTERRTGRSTMPGVPARWRDEAEAYFRRLADESQ